MSQTRLIALPCRISQGVVSDERVFEITLTDPRAPYASVAPVHYFWNAHGERLRPDEPTNDTEIEGKIAARLLERQNGVALVSIPDGCVIEVKAESLQERPTEVRFDVPVGPRS